VQPTKKRRQRIRSPHPGVVLIRRPLPSGASSWRARYEDPDTGHTTYQTLDPVALRTAKARELWAKRKAEALHARRAELGAGAAAIEPKPLADALASYRKVAKHRLRPKTVENYELGLTRLERWAELAGIKSTGDITRAKLVTLREHMIVVAPRAIVKGGKRGEHADVESKRAPASINRDLQTAKTLLNAWHLAGLVRVHRDDIASALKALPVARELPEFLRPGEARKLLEAALRYDADTFAETRKEHASRVAIGTTPRYTSIAPFVAFLLLSGCRRGEALELRWDDVDLDALDVAGERAGEIRLGAQDTKTRHGRIVVLEVSPALRALLAALKLRRGGAERVFHRLSVGAVEKARGRLAAEFGAPAFDWHTLRRTCGTILTCAPGIFGAAAPFLSAKQLGHSVTIAERHYAGVLRGIPRDARSVEAALQVEDVLRDVTARVSTTPAARAELAAAAPP
jgi:integrase